MSLKILIISNLYPNRLENNRATFNRRQFFELSRSCSVKVIAQVAWTNQVFLKWSTGQSIPYKETIDGIETYHPTYFFTPKIFRPLYGLFCFLSINAPAAKLIKSMRPDCIFATWAYPDGFAAVLLGRLYKIPVFIKVHGSDIHNIQSRLRSKLTAWGLKKARKVFSVSRDLKRRIVKMSVDKDRIITVYNGIDRSKFFPQDKIEARKKKNVPLSKAVMLFVGNLEIVKGPDVLIDAFNKINSDTKNYVLYITGRGKLLKSLQEKCNSYGLGESVIFTGSVAHDDMALWMNIADLLIVPSRNEGVPNVILEAMACEIPVVATRVGGISEVVVENETGLLVEPNDPDKLARAIEEALAIKWNKEAISKQSEKYTWEESASSIIEWIQRGLRHNEGS